MNGIKAFLAKAKMKLVGGALAGIMAVATAVSASAEEADYTAQILEQFEGAAADVIPIILGVMGVGLGIFAIFKGIKLAKKMFGTVSNG